MLDGTPLVALCRGVYIDPASSPEARDKVRRAYVEALAGLAAAFGAGAASDPPAVILCTTDPCALRFMGPTRRSRAFMKPRAAVAINGIDPLTKGTILHEMVHVEIRRRQRPSGRELPAWFDEGVASFVGDNTPCPSDYVPPLDDLRRLRAGEAWENFTNVPGKLEATYCQARNEIAAWTARRGKGALVAVIDEVAGGRSFEEVYGPLVVPPTASAPRLDGKFALDENTETNGVDSTGGPHLASLMNGAVWAPGHRRSGVKVVGGAFVRLDDLLEYGLPDKAFTISFWAKPLTNAHVLIHTATNASGGLGWCMPLLGHDAGGKLVAQVPFAPRPEAFLSATGPVLPLGKWSHVAVSWEGAAGLRLYVDGTLVASRAPQSDAEHHRDAPAMPIRLFFGGDNDAKCWTKSIEPGHWNGTVDELHVYDYALAPDAVRADMRE